jgi:NADH-quinone oxidoreductase subunit H
VPERAVKEQEVELASDFPVPPLDLKVPPHPTKRAQPRQRGVRGRRREAVTTGAPAKESDDDV